MCTCITYCLYQYAGLFVLSAGHFEHTDLRTSAQTYATRTAEVLEASNFAKSRFVIARSSANGSAD